MCFCDMRPPVIVTGTPFEGVDRHSRFSAVDGPRSLPYEDIHRLQGSFQPHLAAATSLLPFIQGCERGRALGHRSSTSPFSRSTWRFKSKDASWACMTSSPRMKSSVILATNTQVVSGAAPAPMSLKLKGREGSPVGGCRVHFVDAPLVASPPVMSGLVMICVIRKH
jgi:hypothetical protein